MSITIRIDEHACAAHGDCAAIAPQAFAVEDAAVVVGSAPLPRLLAAAQACPAVAISLVDDATGAQLYP